MGDRAFLPEGDSGYLAHLGQGPRGDRWDGPAPPGAPGDDATAGVVRRLQSRLDRQLWLLERLQAEQLYPEPPGLPEIMETARRIRRDTESLLLLCGSEPGVRSSTPRPLRDVVADAAASAEEPRRVEVRPAPPVAVAPAAAVELLHVLSELVDHVTTVYPGTGIELVARRDGLGAAVDVVVDGLVDGTARHDPEGLGGRRAAAAAEQLAQRSRHGIVLRLPPGRPPTGSGIVASVHCPPGSIIEEPVGGASDLGLPLNGAQAAPHRSNGVAPARTGVNGAGLLDEELLGPRPSLGSPSSRPPSSKVDELFGPLIDLPLEPIDDRYATPIFEAIASAWFREDGPDSGNGAADAPLDWDTPHDSEWREAAARAARSEEPTPTTATGLPRRRPGSQLVPPPRAKSNRTNGSVPAERVPGRVRDRLSNYQRGLQEGRHRRPGPDGPEPEDW